ncbi:MAG: hypothetical protein AAF937_05625 [Planctomycetota bacterium]
MTPRTMTAAFVSLATLAASQGAAVLAQPFDAARLAADLTSGETARVQDARDAAVGYLGNPGLSVSDRLAAVSAVESAVTSAAESEDEFVGVNALLIAGQFVTPSGFQLLTDRLDDETPGVRYSAYRGLRSAFGILADQNAPSLQPAAARTAFDRLAEAARSEQDANTLESAYRALAEPLTVSASPLKPLETQAGATLARVADERVAQLALMEGDSYALTLGAVVYVSLEYRRLLGTPGRRFDDATLQSAAALSGELIGHAYDEFQRAGSTIDGIDADRRALLRQTLSAAESLAFVALRGLGESVAPTTLAEAFENGDNRAFRAGVLRIIGPAGSLSQAGVAVDGAPSGG